VSVEANPHPLRAASQVFLIKAVLGRDLLLAIPAGKFLGCGRLIGSGSCVHGAGARPHRPPPASESGRSQPHVAVAASLARAPIVGCWADGDASEVRACSEALPNTLMEPSATRGRLRARV
jgi:hypothetical protein